MAPLVKRLEEAPWDSAVCITAQHREMLDQVLGLFDIQPQFDLDVMTAQQDLYDVTAKVLSNMRDVLRAAEPDLVLVHGDTTTAFAAALAAYYEHVPIGHVEAGLRTGDLYSPWPEESNRKLVGALADLHFSPTESSQDNLIKEGVPPRQISITGNTVIDALHWVVRRSEQDEVRREMEKRFPFLDPKKKLILVTAHRRESFGDGFDGICQGINTVAARHSDCQVIYPVHPNPKVKRQVNAALANTPNVYLIDPLDYLPFIFLMNQADIVLTDSGGIQEEAPSLGKPVLVMRDVTERPEAVTAGTVKLVGTDPEMISDTITRLLTDKATYDEMAQRANPYGDGQACERIVDRIADYFLASTETKRH